MGRQTAKRRQHTREPFVGFSADAMADLRPLLGARAGTVVPQLQDLVREHLGPRARSRGGAWPRPPASSRRDGSVKIQKTITALRVVIRQIDEVLPFLKTVRVLTDLVQGGSEWDRMTAFRVSATDRLRRLEGLHAMPSPMGRPTNIERRWLSYDVAVVLRLGGISVTASRSGKFASVLEVVLSEAYGSAPLDQFRLIKTIAGEVTNGTLPELRRAVENAADYYSDPPFWRRLAAVR